jgi:hypothetical protein
MQRRTLLKLGIGSAVVLAAAGASIALMPPAWRGGRLADSGRAIFRAVAAAVLDGMLPTAPAERETALLAHLERLDGAIAAFPAATQAELAQLLGLLAVAPGRIGLAGLQPRWESARVEEVQHALQSMRSSSLALRQQSYQALRDLTNAAYFSDPTTWRRIGYPGPVTL